MDWKTLLKELDDAGFTQTRIAAHCGVAQSTVSDLARGASKEPSFAFGAKLVELHGARQLTANPAPAEPAKPATVEAGHA